MQSASGVKERISFCEEGSKDDPFNKPMFKGHEDKFYKAFTNIDTKYNSLVTFRCDICNSDLRDIKCEYCNRWYCSINCKNEDKVHTIKCKKIYNLNLKRILFS